MVCAEMAKVKLKIAVTTTAAQQQYRFVKCKKKPPEIESRRLPKQHQKMQASGPRSKQPCGEWPSTRRQARKPTATTSRVPGPRPYHHPRLDTARSFFSSCRR